MDELLYTSSTNLASMIEAFSAVLVIGALMMFISASKYFKSEEIGKIIISLIFATSAILLIRLLSLFDVQIFKIHDITLYRALLGLVIAISIFVFAKLFFNFSKQYGFNKKNKKKTKGEKKLAKALGGQNG